MQGYKLYQLLADWVPALFVFAFGACVGSLINVIAYRLPLGIGIVSPPSRCPSCQTQLTWRENIPIFGWIFLGGKCRFCKSKISPEYPIVEAITGVLFFVVYAALYLIPRDAVLLGIPVGTVSPDWAQSGPSGSWPICAVWLILTGALVAMTITDLKTYTIPLVLTWTPAVVALVVFPVYALILGQNGLSRSAPGTSWSIPLPGSWETLGGIGGAVIGLVVANVLVATGLLRRSYEDYDEWAKQAVQDAAEAKEAESGTDQVSDESAGLPSVDGVESTETAPTEIVPSATGEPEDSPEMWIQYPHARREMVRELAFLGPIALLAYAGLQLGARFGGDAVVPLWLDVLGGVAMGYLVGGGVIWGVRILGSLAFGKEAMGLGDVHLLAGVGACLGWIDTVLIFFSAVLVGLWAAISGLLAGLLGKSDGKSMRMLAFGPCLAVGTLVVMLGKPMYEWFLGLLFHQPGGVNLP